MRCAARAQLPTLPWVGRAGEVPHLPGQHFGAGALEDGHATNKLPNAGMRMSADACPRGTYLGCSCWPCAGF